VRNLSWYLKTIFLPYSSQSTGFPRLALPQERFLAIMVLRVFRCWIISMHFIRYKEICRPYWHFHIISFILFMCLSFI
jgi:hypothetical protein